MATTETGERLILGTDEDSGKPLGLDIATLARHVAIIGSSGSGKTVTAKVLVEEAAMAGIPVICVDPQGDIASLALPARAEDVAAQGVANAADRIEAYRNSVEVITFTPSSSAGVPICLNPLHFELEGKNEEERVREQSFAAKGIASLLGYEPGAKDTAFVESFLELIFNWCHHNNRRLRDFTDLAGFIKQLPADLAKRAHDIVNKSQIDMIMRQVNTLTVGARKLLFTHGTPLDIPTLIANEDGTTRVSVIYLNTLGTQEEKEFFVAELAGRIYDWMLENPSKDPQLLLYIDEVAPFLPPVKKPACKEILETLLRQARKYGVSCLLATQSPGDIDYKSLGQVATIALGRLSTQQDQKKVEKMVKSLAPDSADAAMSRLASMETGNFLLLSPDQFPEPKLLRTRWLLTEHRTIDEENLESIISNSTRDMFAERARDLRKRQTRVLAGLEYRIHHEEDLGLGPASSAPMAPVYSAIAKRHNAEGVADQVDGIRIGVKTDADDIDPMSTQVVDATRIEEYRRRELLDYLSKQANAFTQQQLADGLKWTKLQIARELREMETLGAVKRARVGQRHVFYSAEYQFHPRLGITAALHMAPLLINEQQAKKTARRNIPTRGVLLGGKKGDIASTRLLRLPLWQVNFVGKVSAGVLWWQKLKDKRESVYFHPTQDKVQILLSVGFVFDDEVNSNPALIKDLDNITHLERGLTLQVEFVEERMRGMHTPKKVEEMFCRRFNMDRKDIISIVLVFIPVWEFSLQSHGTGKRWTDTIDGITGNHIRY
ncbi:MAG: helicase HerA-like domain-containing protein [Planctomycetota bacterium]